MFTSLIFFSIYLLYNANIGLDLFNLPASLYIVLVLTHNYNQNSEEVFFLLEIFPHSNIFFFPHPQTSFFFPSPPTSFVFILPIALPCLFDADDTEEQNVYYSYWIKFHHYMTCMTYYYYAISGYYCGYYYYYWIDICHIWYAHTKYMAYTTNPIVLIYIWSYLHTLYDHMVIHQQRWINQSSNQSIKQSINHRFSYISLLFIIGY